MIVSAGIATTARARALTPEKVARLDREFAARPADDPWRRVDDLMHDISDGVWFAGHLQGIEFEVWRMLDTHPRTWEPGSAETTQVKAWVEEIRSLTIEVPEPWWVSYETLVGTIFDRYLDVTGHVVTMTEWETIRHEAGRR